MHNSFVVLFRFVRCFFSVATRQITKKCAQLTISLECSSDDLLNRNVILRKHDDNGLVFVTERNTKKYKDFKV